jgi:hypothetical protein
LRTIHGRAASAGQDVGGFRFMVLLDDGSVSPDPPLIAQVWDYLAYLRWMEATLGGPQETLPVVRRRTFDRVRYSEGRADEALYHLDFAKQFRIGAYPDVVRLYHQDAGNQRSKPSVGQLTGEARDQALQTESLLKEHHEALERCAPRVHQRFLAELAITYFLAGRRIDGTRAALRALGRDPFAGRQWLLLLLGMAGPRPLAFTKMLHGKTRTAVRFPQGELVAPTVSNDAQ